MLKSLAKRKQNKNKTKKNKLHQPNHNPDHNPIWDNYGQVLNSKTNKYVRLGSNDSMKVINELEHNVEWKKRVEYIIAHHGVLVKNLKIIYEKRKHIKCKMNFYIIIII